MKHVILSTDDNLEYAALLPLTVAIWNKLGFHVQLIVVTDAKQSPALSIIEDHMVRLEYTFHVLDPLPGYKPATVAQVARLFPHCIENIASDDVAITSDADMWPIDPNFFQIHRPFKIWRFRSSPKAFMCYVGGLVSNWRCLMKPHDGPRHAIQNLLAPDSPPNRQWIFDEALLNEQLKTWWRLPQTGVHERLTGGPNNLPFGRLDRSTWNFTGSLDGLIDAHLPRSPRGLDADLWSKIFPLFKAIAPKRADWAQGYYDAFTNQSKPHICNSTSKTPLLTA